MISIQVVRYSFFRPVGHRGSTLRFTERSPEGPCEEGRLCNCTQAVCERPPGDPVEIKQEILAKGTLPDGLRARHRLSGGYAPEFCFEWGDALVTSVDDKGNASYRKIPGREDHAFFTFGINRNFMKAQINLPGYGPVNCFFGNLFFGPDVDTSKLMNGHSPSRIVRTSEIAPKQLWVHRCIFGAEAMAFLSEGIESDFWWDLKGAVDAIREDVQFDLKPSPEQIRLAIEMNRKLVDRIENVSLMLAEIIHDLKSTELFRQCDKVSQAATTEHHERVAQEIRRKHN